MGTGQDDRGLGDLTTQMTGWHTGGADLYLNDAELNAFLDRLEMAKQELQAQLAGANGLASWISHAPVGKFNSATDTRTHLGEDIEQFIQAVNGYLEYLDAVKRTTDGARASLHNADQPR